MEQENKKLKAELNRINGIQPDDNLNFLVNQIMVGNITTNNNKRVLNILNEVKLGISTLSEKLKQERNKNKKKINNYGRFS